MSPLRQSTPVCGFARATIALAILCGLMLFGPVGCGDKKSGRPEFASKDVAGREREQNEASREWKSSPNSPPGLAGPDPRPSDGDLKVDALQEETAVGGLPSATRRPAAPRAESRFDGGAPGEKSAERKPGDGKKEDKKAPQTWKRNAGQPTVARVYVGDGNALELVSLQVTVTVDGPRARTVVDHIFHNPHARQLEGTFEYPMPTGASPSYFAMFLGQTRETAPARFAPRGETPALTADQLARLTPEQLVKEISTAEWGTLQEARVVGKQKALETYEETVRGRIDPALLEYAGGNTFRGRVFPIPSKGFNRVIIAYEELLPVSQEKCFYRFPLPDCPLKDLTLTLQASTVQCKDAIFKPENAKKDEGGSQVLYTKNWTDKGPGGEVLFAYSPPRPALQVISGRTGDSGPLYVYARVRPDLKAESAQPFAKHAVFLLDISQSEHPDRFNVNMKLLRKILEGDKELESFNIIAFNIAATWVNPSGWLPNTEAGREKAFARLDGVVLEGATDFGAALEKLTNPVFRLPPGASVDVFVLSDGQITWGEPNAAHLVARFDQKATFSTRFHCYRTGLGADNLELFEALTRQGGGIFNCFTEADLNAAATAHRQECLQIDNVKFIGGPQASEVLIAGRKAAVYPGGELIVAARLASAGKTQLIVEGKYRGQKFVEEFPIEAGPECELAPRAWGEIAVASLLALNDPRLDELVTAYCQQFGIASRAASFLVLENNADFKRLDLEKERGKTVPGGDVGKFLDDAWQKMGLVVSAKDTFLRFLETVEPRVKLLTGAQGEHIREMLNLAAEADFELPDAPLAGAILKPADVPPLYLATRNADRRNADNYLTESARRARAKDTDGAIRVLSSIVEEFPTRGDALRLVGYRLLDLKQPVHAAGLFERVQLARPFEPHSYLDLARALEESGKHALAAVQYEIVLAGTWHPRFHQSLKVVAQEDYGRMMRQAIRTRSVKPDLADHFGNRLEQMDPKKLQADLRVSMSWNTDATDVDLWVIEPDGTKCFYQHRQTKNGGELTDDVTQGFGPERFAARKAMKGEYVVVVHYYSANPNLLAGETHVSVIVTQNSGTPDEVAQRHTVILKKGNQQVEVCRIKVKE